MNATVHYVNELPQNETVQRCINCGEVIRDLNATVFILSKPKGFPKGEVFEFKHNGLTRLTSTVIPNITINKCSN